MGACRCEADAGGCDSAICSAAQSEATCLASADCVWLSVCTEIEGLDCNKFKGDETACKQHESCAYHPDC